MLKDTISIKTEYFLWREACNSGNFDYHW